MEDKAVSQAPTKAGQASRTLTLAKGALLIALLAVSAQVTIPLGPVPFTLQTAVVALVALLCTPKETLLATGGYLALGALGLPVFSAARGGLAMILGPTGGFLYGFVIAAFVGAAVRVALAGSSATKARTLGADIVCVALVMLLPYVTGIAQLMYVAHMGFAAAFAAGAAPFLLLDACKVALAVVIALAVRRALAALPVRDR